MNVQSILGRVEIVDHGGANAKASIQSGQPGPSALNALAERLQLRLDIATRPGKVEVGGCPNDVATLLIACGPISGFKVYRILWYQDQHYATAELRLKL
jgi:hypothetical protein